MHYISTPSLKKWGEINCMQLCSWTTERDKITQYLVCDTVNIIKLCMCQ